MERRLDDSQNRSPLFGEEEEIGNVTVSRSHLAHGVVIVPTELYRFLAQAEPAVITPPPPETKIKKFWFKRDFWWRWRCQWSESEADYFEHFSYVVELMVGPEWFSEPYRVSANNRE